MKDKINNLKNTKAKSVNDIEKVTFSLVDSQYDFPLVITSNYPDIHISVWMQNNRDLIDLKLKHNGAILFRGFQVNSIEKFQSFITYFGQEVLEYTLRSSPRYAVGEKVYISTKYPPEYAINMHSESSYAPVHPKKIAFCCIDAPDTNGETPIADNRIVLRRISETTRQKFNSLGVRYRRFFSNGIGMSWQEAFQTDNKQVVEAECRNTNIEFKWENENDLVLEWNKKAIWNHPETNDSVWFNHALFFNRFAPGYEDLNSIDNDKLPNNTFFGDGTIITKEEIHEILVAYKESTVQFQWEKGDVLLLDNMLMSHGRNPYKGNRNIIVSMT